MIIRKLLKNAKNYIPEIITFLLLSFVHSLMILFFSYILIAMHVPPVYINTIDRVLDHDMRIKIPF